MAAGQNASATSFRARPEILWERRDQPDIEITANSRVAPDRGLLLQYVYERAPAVAAQFHNVAATDFWSLRSACGS